MKKQERQLLIGRTREFTKAANRYIFKQSSLLLYVPLRDEIGNLERDFTGYLLSLEIKKEL